VRGGYQAARAVLLKLELVTRAVSLGSVDTLIEHPVGLTHRIVDEDALAEVGVTPDLLRLSVGLEDPADILADLGQALDAVIPMEAAALATP